MHSTCKGNQWYFGMKAHIGVDSTSKIVHTLETTAADEEPTQMCSMHDRYSMHHSVERAQTRIT